MPSLRRARWCAPVLVVGAMLAPGIAHAGQYAEFDRVTLNTPALLPPTLHVANNGTRWTHVVAEKMRLAVKVDIKVKKGTVTGFALYNGGAPAIESENILNQWVEDRTKHFSKVVQTDEITADRLGNGINSIVSACNQRLAEGADILKAQPPFVELASIGIKARADKNIFNAKPRYKYANGLIAVSVVCDAPPTHIVAPPPERTPTPAKVSKADLAIVTMDKHQGKHCPRIALLVARFDVDRKGSVEFILRRSDGESDKLVTAEAEKLPDGRWRAEYTRKYEFGSSADRKYMIEVVGQAKASAWTSMTIRCGDLIEGGLTGGAKATTGSR